MHILLPNPSCTHKQQHPTIENAWNKDINHASMVDKIWKKLLTLQHLNPTKITMSGYSLLNTNNFKFSILINILLFR